MSNEPINLEQIQTAENSAVQDIVVETTVEKENNQNKKQTKKSKKSRNTSNEEDKEKKKTKSIHSKLYYSY